MFDEEFKIAIALIKQKSEFIETALLNLSSEVKEIKDKLDSNFIVTKEEFDRSNVQYRWLFAVLITIVIGTFIKVIFG